MWHRIPMAKQSWAQRSRSWKLDHICYTSSGLHFIQLQTTILDVLKHVTARLYILLLDASEALLPWHWWLSTITKKALRFPTASFSWTLGFSTQTRSPATQALLNFPHYPSLSLMIYCIQDYMFYSSSSFPSTSTTLMEKTSMCFTAVYMKTVQTEQKTGFTTSLG